MRIRKGRPLPCCSPPLPPSACMTKPRFGYHSRQGSHFDDRFSVEEENRRIGWKFYPVENQDGRENHPLGELQQTITGEMEALNCIDKKKDKKHCMQKIPSQALRGRRKEKPNEKGSTSTTAYQGNGYSSGSKVIVVLALPSASFQLGKEFPLKERGYNYQWRSENVAREEEGDKVTKVKTETMEMHEQEDINKDADNQRTKSISSIINRDSVVPRSTIDSMQMHQRQQVSILKETTVEQKETPRRGRKRKANYQSGDGNGHIEYEGKQKPKRGKLRVKDQYGAQQKRKRGRPKKVKDQLVNKNNEYVRKLKRKRGRPKKVRDHPINANNELSPHDLDYKPTYI